MTLPDDTMGGLLATSGMFSRSHSAATRLDSFVPASSSQAVIETVASLNRAGRLLPPTLQEK